MRGEWERETTRVCAYLLQRRAPFCSWRRGRLNSNWSYPALTRYPVLYGGIPTC